MAHDVISNAPMRTLILFLVFAGACSRSETSEPAEQAPEPAAEEAVQAAGEAAPEQPPTPPAGSEAPVNLDEPPTIELLDAGRAPLKTLRTTFQAGVKQSLQIESVGKLATVYGPMLSTSSVMPTLVYELETQVKRATEEGAQFDFRIKTITAKSREGVKPAQVESANKVGSALEGATGSFSINAQGMVEDFSIDTSSSSSVDPGEMIDQIKQAIRLSSLPLPKEPVGRGATWTATQVIERRTAKIRHTSTIKLVDVKGEQVTATSTQATETPKQKLSFSNVAFMLDDLDFSGETKGTWRLDQLGPTSASEQTGIAFKMTATAPRREAVVMALDTSLDVKAKN